MFKRSPLTLSEPVGIKSGLNLRRYFLTFDDVSGEIVIVKGVTGSGCVLFMMSGAWLEAWGLNQHNTIRQFLISHQLTSQVVTVCCPTVFSLQSIYLEFRLLTLREDLKNIIQSNSLRSSQTEFGEILSGGLTGSWFICHGGIKQLGNNAAPYVTLLGDIRLYHIIKRCFVLFFVRREDMIK